MPRRYAELWEYPTYSLDRWNQLTANVIYGSVTGWNSTMAKAKAWEPLRWVMLGSSEALTTCAMRFCCRYTDRETGMYAQNVAADVLFLNGEFDGQTPMEQANLAYAATRMARGSVYVDGSVRPGV